MAEKLNVILQYKAYRLAYVSLPRSLGRRFEITALEANKSHPVLGQHADVALNRILIINGRSCPCSVDGFGFS